MKQPPLIRALVSPFILLLFVCIHVLALATMAFAGAAWKYMNEDPLFGFVALYADAAGTAALAALATWAVFVIADPSRLRGMRARLVGRADGNGVVATRWDAAFATAVAVAATPIMWLVDCGIYIDGYWGCHGPYWFLFVGITASYLVWLAWRRRSALVPGARSETRSTDRRLVILVCAALATPALYLIIPQYI